MPAQELDGILNLNKPPGMTSHDVVAFVRRISGQRRAGHAGTLDPMATGVLLVCLGQAARVAEYLMASDKVYLARLRLGIATDTYDAEGEVTQRAEVRVTREQFEQALSAFVGTLEQTPPMYSAVKHQGTPLYRLARRGETVHTPARRVKIYTLSLKEWAPPTAQIEVHCSKGTYIRSLVHDLGQRLECGAHLVELVRIASGAFRIEEAVSLAELEAACRAGKVEGLLQPLDRALSAFPAIVVDEATAARIACGQRVRLPEDPGMELCRAYAADGHLLAMLRASAEGLWQPHKVFCRLQCEL